MSFQMVVSSRIGFTIRHVRHNHHLSLATRGRAQIKIRTVVVITDLVRIDQAGWMRVRTYVSISLVPVLPDCDSLECKSSRESVGYTLSP